MPKLGYEGNGYRVVRCQHCGDSNNPNHGHLIINYQKGLYNCLKCEYGGRVDKPFLLKYGLEYLTETVFGEEYQKDKTKEFSVEKRVPYQYSERSTFANVEAAYREDRWWDYVDVYSPTGHRLGFHLRSNVPDKRSFTTVRGLVYPYAPNPLKSSYSDPITIVEGIYDIQSPNDCAVLGSITKQQMDMFTGQFIILRPDGDVWEKESGRKNIHSLIGHCLNRNDLFFLGVHKILNGLDIDEVTDKDSQIKFLSKDYWLTLFNR